MHIKAVTTIQTKVVISLS